MQIAISNIFYRRHSSPVIATLSKLAKAHRDSNAQAIEDFYNILVQVGDLSIEMDEISTKRDSAEDPALIIGKALHIDADLVSWALSINPAWRYKTVTTPSANTRDHTYSVYHGSRYHVYPKVGCATMWNNYHQARIVVHGIVRSSCTRLLALDSAHECQTTMLQSAVISKQMVDDICASVPYYFAAGEVGVGGLIRLSWPLFIAADCSAATPAMKWWILQTLDLIGNTTGAQQALTMSQLVKEGHSIRFIPGNVDR
ncbi:uncharacterized protein N7482_002373 [Penicillium canariense]|uniref:Uncharacterized protein n=1 Tax=Penicillium canariense TaxID=189055 RepID=A0A9W9LTY6_9EURO|nr:uncharacterized protein N7482_002373 [Penicillium canariense]KAJ5176496.1 hypothetical protein N7482_002373 [Penicillium canariense]